MKRLLFVAVVGACGGDARQTDEPPAVEAPAAPAAPAEVTFAPSLGVELSSMTRLPNGVYVQDVQAGRGLPVDSTTTVTIEYRAWLADGTLFEQRPSDDGFGASEFRLSENPPVPGLASGIAGMRRGGVRRIVVPPELGYDLIGRPPGVPADAVLVFEVRLMAAAS